MVGLLTNRPGHGSVNHRQESVSEFINADRYPHLHWSLGLPRLTLA